MIDKAIIPSTCEENMANENEEQVSTIEENNHLTIADNDEMRFIKGYN